MANQINNETLPIPDRYVYKNNTLYEWEYRQVYSPDNKGGTQEVFKNVEGKKSR